VFDGSLETQDELLGKIEAATEDVAQILSDIMAILAKVTGTLRKLPGGIILAGVAAIFILGRKK
jgi:hypothetical protein